MFRLKTLLVVLCFVFVSGVTSSFAGQTIMRIGWATPIEHDYGIFAQKFADLVDKYTDGSVEVKMFPSAQLGTEDGAFKSLQLGTVDCYIITCNNISPHYPLIDVFVLPYIFPSQEDVPAILSGPVGNKFFAEMQRKTKVQYLTYGPVSYRDVYNTKKDINTMKDFSGLKYRVPKNAAMIATYKGFGAEPVPLAWSETPTALQTGTVDGGDNGIEVIRDMKFYELAKHLTVLEHFTSFSPLLASERFMKKLNAKQQEAVKKAAREANVYIDKISQAATEEIRSFLASKGMKITRPDKKEFIKAGQAVHDIFAAQKGEEFSRLLQTVRQSINK